MGDEFVITSEIMENPKFLACSMLARNIYMAMILRTDNEGRALADPMTWQSKAACWGAAQASHDEIEAALAELDACRLAPQYESGGRVYVFLPGRFEHNPGRTYWKRSKCPLPPISLLEEFPEYLQPLQRLTTKSELRNSLRDKENWRYPEIAQGLPTPCPDDSGIERATPVGVGVEVGVNKRGERAREAVDGCVPVGTPLWDPESPPSPDQKSRIGEMAEQRGLGVAEVAADCGVRSIGKGDVTRIMDFLRVTPKLTEAQKAEKARSAAASFLIKELNAVHQRDGPEEAAVWVRRQEREDHDPKVIKRLWARLTTLNNEQEAMA